MTSNESSQDYVDSALAYHSEYLKDSDGSFYGDDPRLIKRNQLFVPMITNRNLEQVAFEHYLNTDELVEKLEGKTVLDIGGGESRLQDDLNNLGILATVINLDLYGAFTSGSKNSFGSLSPNGKEQAIIGFAQQMPLRDEIIDVAIATYSVPFYNETADDFESVINETLRILKPGGFASFAPFYGRFLRDNTTIGRIRMLGLVRAMSNMTQLEVSLKDQDSPLQIHKLLSI